MCCLSLPGHIIHIIQAGKHYAFTWHFVARHCLDGRQWQSLYAMTGLCFNSTEISPRFAIAQCTQLHTPALTSLFTVGLKTNLNWRPHIFLQRVSMWNCWGWKLIPVTLIHCLSFFKLLLFFFFIRYEGRWQIDCATHLALKIHWSAILLREEYNENKNLEKGQFCSFSWLASTSLYHNQLPPDSLVHRVVHSVTLYSVTLYSVPVQYAAGVTINCPSIMLMLPLSTDQQIEDSSASVTLAHHQKKPKQNGSRAD